MTPTNKSVAEHATPKSPVQTTDEIADKVPDPAIKSTDLQQSNSISEPIPHTETVPDPSWCDLVKRKSWKLQKKGTHFILESGEACVKISNTFIAKNAKSWYSFIIGQFYAEPPGKGAIHAIANGMWSKNLRDINVSKLDGFAYHFRAPNLATEKHILAPRRADDVCCQMGSET